MPLLFVAELREATKKKKLETCNSGRHSGVNVPSMFLSNLEKPSACPQLWKISAYCTSRGC